MNNNLKVIEDCSPYYIRFSFKKLDTIVSFVKTKLDLLDTLYSDYYFHRNFPIGIGEIIISLLPDDFKFDFMTERVSIFETPPRGGCGIHKDGKDHRVSFNIPIEINDDRCVTYWYDDDQFKNFPYYGNLNYGRMVVPNFKLQYNFTHCKSMIAIPNEMVLFNTDIYHSWHNNSNDHSRKILNLRVKEPGVLYFEDAKRILSL